MNEFEKDNNIQNNAENGLGYGSGENINGISNMGNEEKPQESGDYRYSGESIDYSREIIDCTSSCESSNTDSYSSFTAEERRKDENERSAAAAYNNPGYGNYSQGTGINNDMSTGGFGGSEYGTHQPYPTADRAGNGFITIKNIDPEKIKNRKAKLFKCVKTAAVLAVCFASVGAGIGFGANVGKSFSFNSDGASETVKTGSSFKFPEASDSVEASADGSIDANIILTGTNTIAPIINKVKDSVVNISIKTQTTTFFNQVYESTGAGSGIIYDQDDEKVYIVTNNHVVEGASNVQVSITGTEQIPASLVGRDSSSDIAIIYVTKADLAKAGINEVTVAEFADSDLLEVGEYVLALGNALGEGKTVTQGIISASNKEINIDGKKLTVLQTDAAINPGNSGGALIDTDGKVVGINTAKLSSSSVEGIGYAIPSSYVKNVIEEIMVNGTVERPYLGITGYTITDEFKSTYNIDIDGVFLRSVEKGSAAENAGLKYTDIITGFNGKQIKSMDELSAAISECNVNDVVSIEFIRNGTTKMNTTATLQSYSQNF